ncbi:tetratricopeptide repeat protein [Candidatus Poribacteria bacterium]|nr:tetratricopeptide repeat protein [Candidatus Poribacteria bacterium]MYA58822.1 tetratricopeptide repeat protein [Candidatus Poribacteria bacterium]
MKSLKKRRSKNTHLNEPQGIIRKLMILILLWFCSPLSGIADENLSDHSRYVQHVEQAFLLMFQGDNLRAISEFEAALVIEPDHYEILHYLGMAHAQEEFWNKATESYQRSLALMPDNIEALYSLGVAYFRLDRWADAVLPLQRVIELSPQHARGHEMLGKSLVKRRQYAEAVPILTKALSLTSHAANLYYELGIAHLNLKAYPEAIKNFKLAIAHGPTGYAEPHHGLGTAYFRSGDREKSRVEMQIYQRLQKEFAEYERLTRLTRAEPNNLEAWTELATLLMNQKNFAKAVSVFQKCIELAPNNAHFYHGLSRAFMSLNYPKHAAEAARKAVQLMPNQAILYNTLGSTYAMQGESQKALRAFRKAVELDSDEPYYHLNLSRLYEGMGNQKLAQEHHRIYEYLLSKQK